ncbi:c-type cytochrome domain-containing protein [Reichenbachiella sp. MALMAid0571]|uniref:c-type cytochrome domain-containing protein n=1 Tax=Reichenbachiella sp. MALMAid0571 TaxID=3143939 RepID=UPI0032DFCECC
MLLLPYFPKTDLPVLLLFIGRFHPLILHFPIVIIFLTLALEFLYKTNLLQRNERTIALMLGLASLSVFFVVLAGYFLFASGEYTGELIMSHFKAGIFAGSGILITTVLYLIGQYSNRKILNFYFTSLILTNAIVGYASHLGGTITHGKDYLTEYLPEIFNKRNTATKPKEEMLVYEDLIVPFLTTKCISCHNEHKTKGDYLMTSYATLVKGGKSGNSGLVKHYPEQSELYKRITLPVDHDDHMPPEGKKPLSLHEIEIMEYWINAGASTKQLLIDIPQDSAITQTIESYLPESRRLNGKILKQKAEKERLLTELTELAKKLNVSVQEDQTSEENFFTLSMQFPPANFTGEQLKELQAYFLLFTKVSLVASDIKDDDLFLIGQMTNLRELYLQKTAINGSGLVYLKDLQYLERLNLSFTQTNDATVLEVLQFPSLKQVYLFGSQVSPQVLQALRANQLSREFLLEEGPYN